MDKVINLHSSLRSHKDSFIITYRIDSEFRIRLLLRLRGFFDTRPSFAAQNDEGFIPHFALSLVLAHKLLLFP